MVNDFRRYLKKAIINSIRFPLLRQSVKQSSSARIVHVKNGGIGAGGANNYMFEIIDNMEGYEQFIWYERGRTFGFRYDVKAYTGNIKKFLRIVRPKIIQIHFGGGGQGCINKVWELKAELGYKIIFTFHKLSKPFLLDRIDCNLFVNDFYTKLPKYSQLENIKVISGGVNENTYKYQKKIPQKKYTVGRISRVDEEKIDSVMTDILNEFSDRKDIKFYFIGGTKKKIEEMLIPRIPNSLLDRTQIDKRVIKLNDKIDKMRQLDVFIHFTSENCNSGMGENFSIALIEAMMLGIPVVTENRGGIKNQICHGYNGYLCNKVSDYYKYTTLLLDNQDIWTNMSKNARNHAEKYFSSKVMTKKTQKLYEELLSAVS